MKCLVLFALCLHQVLGADQNLVQLAQSLRLNILVKQLQATGLADTLATGGPYTLFAPSDNAFGKLDGGQLNDTAAVTKLLKYHVVSGTYKGADVYNEQKLTSLLGPAIRINRYAHTNKISAEGAPVYRADEIASNGVIWLLDTPMSPPTGSMLDYINNDKNGLTILKKAINTAGIQSALQAEPLTLLAPNDAAFGRLDPGVLDKLLADKAKLTQVLQYHVIPGALFTSGMHSGYVRTLDHGEQLRITFQFFGLFKYVNDAQLSTEDVDVTNGVIHVIDHLLLPPDLAKTISALG
ncbi:transforming growth factor-beta-induced protein ig-h3-like [Liolophura sinensis]|uniref:transforming growth factor-beta-induced protein ig-h3-like n=1 Tax=Liolophura sinensis TaxID=3198878 RepID=UPI003158F926